ncbi:MAG: integration host factor subunit alpha [Thermodesulfobacteriota bacterium]
MAVTKKDLAFSIHEKLGFSQRESADIVDYFFDTVKTALQKGNSVKLPHFGSLYVKERKPRKGRNPATGEEVGIPSRNEVVFKPSRILRTRVNSKPD